MTAALTSSAQLSERGRRPTNQDAVLAARIVDGRALLVVADGMGGHAGGEVASSVAVRTLVARVSEGASLPEAFEAAHAAILERARADPSLQGMGTTLVALLQNGRSYEIVNVGDSRAYRVFPDRVEQVTDDHSFVAEAIRSGQMTEESAVRSPWRNVLTRSLGAEAALQVDRFGPFRVDSLPPHVVVLCSDGLHRTLEPEEIQKIVVEASGPDAAARSLVALALDAGSDDNISVVLRDFGLFRQRVPGGPRDLSVPPLAFQVEVPSAPVHQLTMSAVEPRDRPRPAGFSRISDQVLFIACAGMFLLWLTLLFRDL